MINNRQYIQIFYYKPIGLKSLIRGIFMPTAALHIKAVVGLIDAQYMTLQSKEKD